MLKASPAYLAHAKRELLRCQILATNANSISLQRKTWEATERLLVDLVSRAEVVVPQRTTNAWQLWSLTLQTAAFARVLHKRFQRYSLTNKVYGKLVRRLVFLRDNYCCVYCSARSDLTLDHIEPKALGGTSAFDNLVTACARCNFDKAADHVVFPGCS